MSRAQGDGFRTHTDHELNAYKWRLHEKIAKLTNEQERWYRVGEGWILTTELNRMINPNGSWKWNGWEVEAHEYIIRVFPGECVEIKDGKPNVIGWAQVTKAIDDDKESANKFFKEVAVKLARNLKTWTPSEYDNSVAKVFDYEGRKPSAIILITWDGDTYFWTLKVDGEIVLNAYSREECVKEAERIGAELTETHTP